MTHDPHSITFRAACNEAVDASMRPIRQRVVCRLSQRFESHGSSAHSRQPNHLSLLFEAIWNQASIEVTPPASSPELNDRLVESRFVELVAKDPQWRLLVLDSVLQERRWSDLLSRGYKNLADWISSLLEKLMSPHHPVARRTTGALTSIALTAGAILIPPKFKPDFYKNIFARIRYVIEGPGDIRSHVSFSPEGDPVIHLKAVVDDKYLSTVIKPVVRPDVLSMTLNPVVDASLKITPQIQYSSDSSDNLSKTKGKLPGVPIRFVPTVDPSPLSKLPWDPTSIIKVSVQELNPPSGPQSQQQSTDPQGAPPETAQPTASSARPLDRIGDDLSTLNASLGVLGSEFQAPKEDPESNLATLQQSQNLIHSTATNQGHTTAVEVRSNSVHSVVLQWFVSASVPESCTVTFKVGDVNADKIVLSGIEQHCSSNTTAIKGLQGGFPLGPGNPKTFDRWTLSVDETHRRWLFLHAATLRFTWQPSNSGGSHAQNLAH